MFRYMSMKHLVADTNEWLDNMGWNDGSRVIAVSVISRDPDEIYNDGYHHQLKIALAFNDANGNTMASDLYGNAYRCDIDEKGGIFLMSDIGTMCEDGPIVSDYCTGRLLAWLSEYGAEVTDIEEGWRKWPAKDGWYPVLQDKDYSTNFSECPYCDAIGECWNLDCAVRGFKKGDN